jgi:hypothetical protein
MSYEQLMQHAAEIERLAVKGALEQKGFVYDPTATRTRRRTSASKAPETSST